MDAALKISSISLLISAVSFAVTRSCLICGMTYVSIKFLNDIGLRSLASLKSVELYFSMSKLFDMSPLKRPLNVTEFSGILELYVIEYRYVSLSLSCWKIALGCCQVMLYPSIPGRAPLKMTNDLSFKK